jgi:two-component system LytT family response regulator
MIVDDEAPAREGLRLRLRREPDVAVIGEFGDARAALAAVVEDPPDVLFLDIRMPGLDGVSLAARLPRGAVPAVVFVTAFDEHAVRAFDLHALDYLLKPVEQARLREALDRARTRIAREDAEELAGRLRRLVAEYDGGEPGQAPASDDAVRTGPAQAGAARSGPTPGGIPRAMNPQPGPPSAAGRIAVRADGAIRFVDPADVDWIEAAGDSVRLHVGADRHLVRASMAEILGRLPAGRFARIHRSTIVNLARVQELQPWFHGEYVVLMRDGTRLRLSRGYRKTAGRQLGLD